MERNVKLFSMCIIYHSQPSIVIGHGTTCIIFTYDYYVSYTNGRIANGKCTTLENRKTPDINSTSVIRGRYKCFTDNSVALITDFMLSLVLVSMRQWAGHETTFGRRGQPVLECRHYHSVFRRQFVFVYMGNAQRNSILRVSCVPSVRDIFSKKKVYDWHPRTKRSFTEMASTIPATDRRRQRLSRGRRRPRFR